VTGAANLSCGRLCCPRAATPRPAGACGRLAVIPELHFFLKSTLARPEAQQRASPSSTAPGLQQAPDASARPLAQQAPAASTAPQAGATWRAQGAAVMLEQARMQRAPAATRAPRACAAIGPVHAQIYGGRQGMTCRGWTSVL